MYFKPKRQITVGGGEESDKAEGKEGRKEEWMHWQGQILEAYINSQVRQPKSLCVLKQLARM